MRRIQASDGVLTVYTEGPDTKRANELCRRRGWEDALLELLKEEFGEQGRPDFYPGTDPGAKAKRRAPHGDDGPDR